MSDICNICNDYSEKEIRCCLLSGCEECHHVYHDKCIEEEFRNKNFETCEDMGYCCADSDEDPVTFKYGKKIDLALTKTKRSSKASKKQSRRQNRNKRSRKSIGGSSATMNKTYESCTYMGIKYKVGDDILINMNSDRGWDIARITEIFKDTKKKVPELRIIWFWEANEIANKDSTVDDDDIEPGSKEDIRGHEIYLDDNYQDLITIENIRYKVLVVPSSDEYVKEIQNEKTMQSFGDIFWCEYGYSDKTKRKTRMPSGAIKSHQTVGITPVKKKKKRNRQQIIEEQLREASKSLMLSAVPKKLTCRDKEHDEIKAYMKQQLFNYGAGSGLYISGMPGTGKTATVRQIAAELQKESSRNRGRRSKKNQVPEFRFVEINAFKLPTPRHLYSELCKKILDKHYSPNTAVKKLEHYFSQKDKNRKICVLLVDELDSLLTRQQKVIYNIFDWPTKANAKLIVIGIANTMNLPERLLPRVSSRMGTSRVVFKSYQRQQLTDIIEHRLSATKVFSSDAIRFCASAVAGVSGDCRAALQICRRAVDFALCDIKQNGFVEKENKANNQRKRTRTTRNKRSNNGMDYDDNGMDGEDIVTLHHLKAAKDEFDKSNDIQIVSTLSLYEKMFLTAMVMQNTRSDEFAATTRKYRLKFDNFVQTRLGESRMNNVHFRNMLERLQDIGIISIHFEDKEWEEFITFKVQISEAAHALQEHDVCAKILSTLQIN